MAFPRLHDPRPGAARSGAPTAPPLHPSPSAAFRNPDPEDSLAGFQAIDQERQPARLCDFGCSPAGLGQDTVHIPLDARPRTARRGPLHDAASQTTINDGHNHSAGPGYGPSQLPDFAQPMVRNILLTLERMTQAGVDRFLLMPIPTLVNGGAAACCGNETDIGRTYYLPDDLRDNKRPLATEDMDRLATIEQYYNTAVDWQTALAWSQLPSEVQRRVLPAITGVNLDDPNGIHAILRLKLEHPKLFHWIGEITLFKEVVDEQNTGFRALLDRRNPVLLDRNAAIHKYLRFAARSGMGVTLHCDLSSARNCVRTGEPGGAEHFEELRALFMANRDATIVWAHMGGLGRFSPPSPRHVALLRELLQACPKLCIDMSWDVVARYFSPHPAPAAPAGATGHAHPDAAADAAARQRLIRAMAALIEEFPDRFLMGSDSLVALHPHSISGTYGIYANQGQGPGTATPGAERAALFDFLSPGTLQRVLHRNFDERYEAARQASLFYEDQVMPGDMHAIQCDALANRRPVNRHSDT